MDSFIKIQDLKTYFPIKKGVLNKVVGYVKAVDGVSIEIRKGETLGLVGESGCGKTTLGRTILRLVPHTAGKIMYEEGNIFELTDEEMRDKRKDMQIVFQDPYSSLNPRQTVGKMISEILTVQGGFSNSDAISEVDRLLNLVGLSPIFAVRYPHEFSGGQRQRVAIAKAMALNPSFVVCDEAVSALDVSIQAQIINLLVDLKEEYKITYLFISHSLNVVRHISDRIAVMYLGKIVELADADELFNKPLHPYTRALLSAIPDINNTEKKDSIILEGDVPSASDIPSGCRFRTRCWKATSICQEVEPEFLEVEKNHFVACHHI